MKRATFAAVLLVLAAGFLVALDWARSPLQRRRFLFEERLALIAGERVAGSFETEHEGPHALGIRISRGPSEDVLGPWIGAGWLDHADPPGMVVQYEIRTPHGVAITGVADEFAGGYARGDEAFVALAALPRELAGPVEAEIRVERAREELAGLAASLVVEAQGDWINYRQLEAGVRVVLVLAVAGCTVLVGSGVAIWVLWRGRRRARALHEVRR